MIITHTYPTTTYFNKVAGKSVEYQSTKFFAKNSLYAEDNLYCKVVRVYDQAKHIFKVFDSHSGEYFELTPEAEIHSLENKLGDKNLLKS